MSKTQRFTLNLRSHGDEPLALALRRACDRCRKRKTRCDGQNNCRSCIKAGVECAYLVAPKPLGRRPRNPKPGKASGADAQRHALDSTRNEKRMERSPINSTDYVTSNVKPVDSLPQALPQDPPNATYPPPESHQGRVDLGLNTPTDWSYPPLSLYSPSMDGGLPFDAGLEALTPAVDPQQGFPQGGFPCTNGQMAPLMDKMDQSSDWTVSAATFLPYVKLFFERLYPVFPVLDRDSLPSDETVSDPSHRSWDRYALLASLAAAVTVQLNIVGPPPECQDDWPGSAFPRTDSSGNFYSADFWSQQALQSRRQWDFMSDPDEATIMTSFFLFEYYGGKNQSQKAWYYLREAIGFALAVGLDDPDTYYNLDPRVSQRRCRLFWLLFITERAYALQHKSSAMLHSTIELPRIFESDNPKLIYGFVSLVNLFKSVDDKFLSLWKGGRGTQPRHEQHDRPSWQRTFCAALADQSVNSVSEVVEIQRLDIMITQQWLHLLAWQMETRRLQLGNEAQGQGRRQPEKGSLAANRKFPFLASRDTLQIITRANPKALESHGIGMEQKIFDIACCLSDVLQCSPRLEREAISMGHQYLHGFMTLLSSFRNQESQYLQPLLARATRTLAAELSVPATLSSQERFDKLFDVWPDGTGETDDMDGGCELIAPELISG